MAVYDYATTFTELLQQKYAKELCSDALTHSNSSVKFINAQTIKLPRMTVSGYKDHTRTPGFNMGTLSNGDEPYAVRGKYPEYFRDGSCNPGEGFLPFFQTARRVDGVFRADRFYGGYCGELPGCV